MSDVTTVHHLLIQPDSYNPEKGTVGVDLITERVEALAQWIPQVSQEASLGKDNKRIVVERYNSNYSDLIELAKGHIAHYDLSVSAVVSKGLGKALSELSSDGHGISLDPSIDCWMPSQSWDSYSGRKRTDEDRLRMGRVSVDRVPERFVSQMSERLDQMAQDVARLKEDVDQAEKEMARPMARSTADRHSNRPKIALGLVLVGITGVLVIYRAPIQNGLISTYHTARAWATI